MEKNRTRNSYSIHRNSELVVLPKKTPIISLKSSDKRRSPGRHVGSCCGKTTWLTSSLLTLGMQGSKDCTNMDRQRGEKRAVVVIGEADDADSCDGLSCSMAATSPCDSSGAGCSDGSTASTTASVPSKKQICGTRTTTNKETLLSYLNAFPQQGLVVMSNKMLCDSCHD